MVFTMSISVLIFTCSFRNISVLVPYPSSVLFSTNSDSSVFLVMNVKRSSVLRSHDSTMHAVAILKNDIAPSPNIPDLVLFVSLSTVEKPNDIKLSENIVFDIPIPLSVMVTFRNP